ncbi:hypothetical protein COV93_02870 [Candidatus Woesearchaeota archaeon CG11_big_fil_rev_8_21_14_0_20_43_8]|nr:MAG: hypothetical protein COV93_02870 [Candidatus Woesearchaeota archaeon CG11_big_fil_rev_8_21_14_0_20_43_8]
MEKNERFESLCDRIYEKDQPVTLSELDIDIISPRRIGYSGYRYTNGHFEGGAKITIDISDVDFMPAERSGFLSYLRKTVLEYGILDGLVEKCLHQNLGRYDELAGYEILSDKTTFIDAVNQTCSFEISFEGSIKADIDSYRL